MVTAMTRADDGDAARSDDAPDDAIAAVLADPAALWGAVCRASCEYLVLVDRSGIIRFCNRTGAGLQPHDVLGRRVFDFAMPDSAAALQAAIAAIFASGVPQTLETRVWGPRREPDEYVVRLEPVFHDDRVAAVLVCCEDVLPLKRSERLLREERTMLRQHLELEAQERQLVSYEIHDGLAQYLAGALMHLQSLERRAVIPGNADLHEALRLLRRATDEARRLIGGLRPPTRDDHGLVGAIEALVAEARTDVPEVVFEHPPAVARIAAPLEAALYRIIQESLSNVRKHAAARHVRVTLEQTPERIRADVWDDGTGFDPSQSTTGRFGLEGIRRRAALLGGDARIESSPGRGTRIHVDLPIAPDR
jgi:signal transduction histidine kinase